MRPKRVYVRCTVLFAMFFAVFVVSLDNTQTLAVKTPAFFGISI
jgi:hypothetical protein